MHVCNDDIISTETDCGDRLAAVNHFTAKYIAKQSENGNESTHILRSLEVCTHHNCHSNNSARTVRPSLQW